MKLKLRLLYKLTLIILLFGYGLIIAGGVFPALSLVCSANTAKARRDALKVHWLKGFSAIVNLSVIRQGELPEQGTLVISNHISWLDIIVVGQYLPAYFVAKSDILSWPVIGYLAKQSGTIFIRRGDKRQIKATAEQMLWVLKQRRTVVAFPEGTTTNGQAVLNFHTSLLQPALLTKSPIQPVALKYQGVAAQQAAFVGDDEFIPHLLKMLSLDKIEVRVSFLPIINSSGKDRHTVGAAARAAILEEITLGWIDNLEHQLRQAD